MAESPFKRKDSEALRFSIPIYLNQRIVFDLLAINEMGFSKLRTVKTAESDVNADKGDVSGELGTSNVFAFLGISMKASKSQSKSKATQTEISEERVFQDYVLDTVIALCYPSFDGRFTCSFSVTCSSFS